MFEPKTGDRILVWDDGYKPRERIFLCMWVGRYVCVDGPMHIGEHLCHYAIWDHAAEIKDVD